MTTGPRSTYSNKESIKMPRTPEYINGSDAYKVYISRGGGLSYPSLLKLLKEDGVAEQPTGVYGGYVIRKAALEAFLNKQLRKEMQDAS